MELETGRGILRRQRAAAEQVALAEVHDVPGQALPQQEQDLSVAVLAHDAGATDLDRVGQRPRGGSDSSVNSPAE